MNRPWEIDISAEFARRLGSTAKELGNSRDGDNCPDIWELTNGDIAVVGRDATDAYATRLPPGVRVGPDERLVIIPGNQLIAAKKDIPDA